MNISIDGMSIELDELEYRMFCDHTAKQPVCCDGWPDAHTAWLHFGHQKFCVTPHAYETPAEAEWMRAMLAKTLASIVRESHQLGCGVA